MLFYVIPVKRVDDDARRSLRRCYQLEVCCNKGTWLIKGNVRVDKVDRSCRKDKSCSLKAEFRAFIIPEKTRYRGLISYEKVQQGTVGLDIEKCERFFVVHH